MQDAIADGYTMGQPFYIFIVDASTSDATTSRKPIAIFNL